MGWKGVKQIKLADVDIKYVPISNNEYFVNDGTSLDGISNCATLQDAMAYITDAHTQIVWEDLWIVKGETLNHEGGIMSERKLSTPAYIVKWIQKGTIPINGRARISVEVADSTFSDG